MLMSCLEMVTIELVLCLFIATKRSESSLTNLDSVLAEVSLES